MTGHIWKRDSIWMMKHSRWIPTVLCNKHHQVINFRLKASWTTLKQYSNFTSLKCHPYSMSSHFTPTLSKVSICAVNRFALLGCHTNFRYIFWRLFQSKLCTFRVSKKNAYHYQMLPLKRFYILTADKKKERT